MKDIVKREVDNFKYVCEWRGFDMRKEKITFEQLSAGALLKFGKLESSDMALLIKEISKYAEVELNEDANLDKYFLMCDGSILLNEKYVYNFYGRMYSSLVDMVQDTAVERYFSNLDITEFVLKKISLIGVGFVVKDGLRDIFSKKQIDAINELYKKGLIEDYMQKDVIYGDYEAIRVTKKGMLVLFMINNTNEVRAFFDVLKNVGYSDVFLNEFLLSQDLSLPCEEILSIDNFTLFCDTNINDINNEGFSRRKVINKKNSCF